MILHRKVKYLDLCSKKKFCPRRNRMFVVSPIVIIPSSKPRMLQHISSAHCPGDLPIFSYQTIRSSAGPHKITQRASNLHHFTLPTHLPQQHTFARPLPTLYSSSNLQSESIARSQGLLNSFFVEVPLAIFLLPGCTAAAI